MSRSKLLLSMCRSCRRSYLTQNPRTFSTTRPSRNDDKPPSSFAERLGISVESDAPAPEPEPLSEMMGEALRSPPTRPAPRSAALSSMLSGNLRDIARSAQGEAATRPATRVSADEPYHLNVYAHKHNMHITFTEPSRNPILSLSVGNIGLKKAQRSSYDACYQLAAYFFRKMAEKQWRVGGRKMTHNQMVTLADIRRPAAVGGSPGIEVILRGYGPGREAFQKALLGTEGRMIKPLVSKVTDATRLKFGGTRSPQVRRLG